MLRGADDDIVDDLLRRWLVLIGEGLELSAVKLLVVEPHAEGEAVDIEDALGGIASVGSVVGDIDIALDREGHRTGILPGLGKDALVILSLAGKDIAALRTDCYERDPAVTGGPLDKLGLSAGNIDVGAAAVQHAGADRHLLQRVVLARIGECLALEEALDDVGHLQRALDTLLEIDPEMVE